MFLFFNRKVNWGQGRNCLVITQVKETCHTSSREQEHLSWRVIKSCAALPLEPTKLNNQHMVLEIPTLTMVTTRYPGMEGGGGGQHGGGLVVGQPPNHNQPPPLNHQPLGLAAPRPLSHHQVVNVLTLSKIRIILDIFPAGWLAWVHWVPQTWRAC